MVIHYQLRGEGQENARWVSEPLRDMFQGVFVKEFLLFYGETLTWYLTVTENGQTRDTAREQVSLTEVDTAGSTRYKLLNQMPGGQKAGKQRAYGKSRQKISVAGRVYLRIVFSEKVGVTEYGTKEFDRGDRSQQKRISDLLL